MRCGLPTRSTRGRRFYTPGRCSGPGIWRRRRRYERWTGQDPGADGGLFERPRGGRGHRLAGRGAPEAGGGGGGGHPESLSGGTGRLSVLPGRAV
ncbi:hypothetical protein B5F19_08215 [Pseudoflavonifractor sp. An184]|nr:hypothetical protein B5F19_08215 [Pseudoflavonifractor sp. An184]